MNTWKLVAVAVLVLLLSGVGSAADEIQEDYPGIDESGTDTVSYGYEQGPLVRPTVDTRLLEVYLMSGSRGNGDINVYEYNNGTSLEDADGSWDNPGSFGTLLGSASAGSPWTDLRSQDIVLEEGEIYAIVQESGDQGYDVNADPPTHDGEILDVVGSVDESNENFARASFMRVSGRFLVERDNELPTFNSASTNPEPPQMMQNVSYSVDLTDPDGNGLDHVNLTVEDGDQTVVDEVRRELSGSSDTADWTDIYEVPDGGSRWLNATITAVDVDGGESTETLNYFLTDTPPNLNLVNPKNATYWAHQRNLEVNVSSNDDSVPEQQVDCEAWNDGVSIGKYSGVGDFTITDSFRQNIQNAVNLTVKCSDSGGSNSSTVYYRVDAYDLLNTDSANTALETANTTYEGSWQLGSMVNRLAVALFWNGTRRTDRTYIGSGIRTENISQFFRPPLVQQNRTNASWRFQYTVNYTLENGTQTVETVNSTATDQEVWIGYFVDEFQFAEDRVIEALDVETSFTNTTAVPDSPVQANSSIWYNGSTTAGNAATFNAYVIGNQTVQTVNTSAYGQTTVSYRGRSKTLATAPGNVTVYNKILTDCSAGTASQDAAVTFVLRDEEERSEKVPGTINYNFDTTVQGRDTDNFAFGRQGKEVSMCLFPRWAEYQITGPIEMFADNYTDRGYSLYNVTINDVPETYDLYLLPEEYSTPVYLRVVDRDGSAMPDVTIKVMRYFVDQDAYITVAKAETDSEGVATTHLRVNKIHYKYVVSRDGAVLRETERQILTCDTVPCTKTITIDPEIVEEYYQQQNGFSSECYLNEDDTLQCTVSYKDGSMQNASLEVDQYMPLRMNRTCSISVQSSASSLICQLNTTAHRYQWQLSGCVDNNCYRLDSGTVGEPRSGGLNSYLLAFIMVLAVAGFGYKRPAQGVLFGFLGLTATYLLRIFTIKLTLISGLGILVLITIIQMER